MKKPRVALYARVSTKQGKQDLATQILALNKYASGMGWKVTETYKDRITGTSVARPGLDSLMAAAVRHEFDTVLIFDLSRLTRRGPASAFELIERLRNCNVDLWSMTEEHFRTPGAAGGLLLAIAAFLAQQERDQLATRVKAGLERAKANGSRLGRRPTLVDAEKLRKLDEEGHSIRRIAAELKVSRSVVARALGKL